MAKAKSTNTREKKITSFQIFTDTKKKINYISAVDDTDITEIVEKSLQNYINQWEKKNGPIPVK
jgi:uncharacterized protein YjaZ